MFQETKQTNKMKQELEKAAKFQQERMYSEKQMDDAYDKGFKDATERMYSEEDMQESFVDCWKLNVPDGIECKVSFNEWFEQFKNK